ncbi:MAG: GNAT family N-acetyltransferase [Bacteroidia bacterium]|jgi:RimJ/RimL family protein N-acetyltransferase|nr:GNAT family N-acetyltransferase [Bacteroidia bacterium]
MIKERIANINDCMLIYNWANQPDVRANSYSKNQITLENHTKWFNGKIVDTESLLCIFENDDNEPIGMVRIDGKKEMNEAIISIIVDLKHRGKGYATLMLQKACNIYQSEHNKNILAYIFITNKASYNSFNKANFKLVEEKEVNGILSYIMIYQTKKNE